MRQLCTYNTTMISVSVKNTKFSQRLALIRKAANDCEAELRTAAIVAITSIKARVQKEGVGLHDTNMKTYSPRYEDWKRKEKLVWRYRDLTVSKAMINDIRITDSKPKQVTVSFGSEEQKEKAGWNQELAPWFGLSGKDRRAANAVLQNSLLEKIKKL